MATELIGIGEFSRMTHLTIKQLRNYHETGLLEPALVDPATGYRSYHLEQGDRARMIKKLRDVDMPVTLITEALDGDRAAVITKHLADLERTVRGHGEAIAALRQELTDQPSPQVELRSAADQHVIAIRDVVDQNWVAEWCGETYARLAARLAEFDAWTAGPDGADYSEAFFADGRGEAAAWSPVNDASLPGAELLPGGEYAVAVHRGAYAFDKTYAALGAFLHEPGPRSQVTSAPGPIREIYVFGPDRTADPTAWITEIWWPVNRTEKRK